MPPFAATLVKPSITAAAAAALLDAAEEAARRLGIAVTIAVVDEAGVLKAFRRMDGAAMLGVELAVDKAYTAVAFGIPTHAWFDLVKDEPPLLHGIVKTRRLIVFGGGYPLQVAAGVAGGIGISGGSAAQDMAIARAALAVLEG